MTSAKCSDFQIIFQEMFGCSAWRRRGWNANLHCEKLHFIRCKNLRFSSASFVAPARKQVAQYLRYFILSIWHISTKDLVTTQFIQCNAELITHKRHDSTQGRPLAMDHEMHSLCCISHSLDNDNGSIKGQDHDMQIHSL